ncbi:hypothetical protein HPB49_023710 [Dermacentor silvarum]|uniref:Uncharacterized protein n=1 Tax=Dermacentor silvarum TaxID=543639 RepID=A0ACB8DRZ2_DERSI|nr:hypothetical protein HPB49_023710 [Dermacentor silvarum]
MPPLPSHEIKIIIRPKGALNSAKIGSPTVTAAVFQAAQLSPADIQQDTVCPNTQQNIVVVTTPSPQNADRYVCIKSIQINGFTHDVNAYETAAEDTTKGVIRGIPLSDTPQQINASIVNTRNPLALAAKRIGTATTVVIAFSGPDVPYVVRYGATLIPCSLYRKQIEICYQCGRSDTAWMSALFPLTRSAEVAESATRLPTTRVTRSARYAAALISRQTNRAQLTTRHRRLFASASGNAEQQRK